MSAAIFAGGSPALRASLSSRRATASGRVILRRLVRLGGCSGVAVEVGLVGVMPLLTANPADRPKSFWSLDRDPLGPVHLVCTCCWSAARDGVAGSSEADRPAVWRGDDWPQRGRGAWGGGDLVRGAVWAVVSGLGLSARCCTR
jgi:hypothetical protein